MQNLLQDDIGWIREGLNRIALLSGLASVGSIEVGEVG